MTSHRAHPSQRDSGPARNCAPANAGPLPLKPSERYVLIAHRVGCSPREAELLWLLANHAPMTCKALGDRMSVDYSNSRVLIHKLRTKRGIPIESHPYVGYSIRPAIREFVLSVVSDAPPGAEPQGLVYSPDFGGRECPPPFQPLNDASRERAETLPSHSVSASLLIEQQHEEAGRCSHPDRTNHP